jgi:hypothetical protein
VKNRAAAPDPDRDPYELRNRAMAKANLIALCDAVVTAVNAAYNAGGSEWATAFTARRAFAELADLSGLKDGDQPLVLFFPHTDEEERIGPTQFEGEYEVMAVIYARVGAAGSSAAELKCEALMLLRDLIRDSLKGLVLSCEGLSAFQARLNRAEATPAYGMDSLIQKHCFCAAQVLTFAVNV